MKGILDQENMQSVDSGETGKRPHCDRFATYCKAARATFSYAGLVCTKQLIDAAHHINQSAQPLRPTRHASE
jgi:hypothetical protein